jgi:hypothetical protein
VFVHQPQAMYNVTVAEVHTYFAGWGRWLVHNKCSIPKKGRRISFSTTQKGQQGIDILFINLTTLTGPRPLWKDTIIGGGNQ